MALSAFQSAYAAGRKAHGGGGGTFMYEGKSFSTDTAEEAAMKKSVAKKQLAKGSGEVASNKPEADTIYLPKPKGDKPGGEGGGDLSGEAMEKGGEVLAGLAGEGSDAGGALAGAGKGASMGMTLGGPPGAAVGAIAGAAMGIMQAKEERAKAQAMGRVEANKERAQAEAGKREARTKMAEAIGTTLRSGKQSVSL